MTTGRINQVTIFTDATETLRLFDDLIELICNAMFFVTFFKGRFLKTLSSKRMKSRWHITTVGTLKRCSPQAARSPTGMGARFRQGPHAVEREAPSDYFFCQPFMLFFPRPAQTKSTVPRAR